VLSTYGIIEPAGALDPLPLVRARHQQRIRFHDLCHTFVSFSLQNGEPPAYVKEQMGHHSIKVTVDIYGHPLPGLDPGGGRSARGDRPPPRASPKTTTGLRLAP